jgi:hypothetical protein
VVEVGGQQALTLNNDLLENTDYFLKIMREVVTLFMRSELKVEKQDAVAVFEYNALLTKSLKSAEASQAKEGGTSNSQQTQSRK